MFKNNKYNFTAILLWMAYFCHGMQAITISQNAALFTEKWDLDPKTAAADILSVVAWTGIGKISFLVFSGPLSDKIGRKPVAVTGLIGYVLMFGTFLVANNLAVASILAFIGGAMTSLFDGSINPALFEMYPENKSTASVLGKTFISVSSILYPLFVAFLASNSMSAELGIWLPFILSIVVLVGAIFAPFPDLDMQKAEGLKPAQAIKELEKRQSGNVQVAETTDKANHNDRAKFIIDGTVLSLFALTIYSNFYLFQQVSKIYAGTVLKMSEGAAASVTSLYQFGGLVATIFFSFLMARGIRDVAILVVAPVFSGLAGLLVYFFPSPMTLTLAGVVVGFCAAGGLLQMGNGVLNQFFTSNKGFNTSVYYFVMALGSYIVPKAASALLAAEEVNGVLTYPNAPTILLLIAATGILSAALMVFVGYRYGHIFGVSIFSNSKKAN
ncbi:MFS transporter [Streptococcus ovis]|uniref:MFS transporter n=1 Tax=Streptococcus ovis TaxID=82806 RepID=UPI00036607D6|nr:MFS transporter [Streptococcus ovis]